MAQKSNGFYNLLKISYLYDLIQKAFGANRMLAHLANDIIEPFENARVLDIGCGTGTIRKFLPKNIYYTGFDLNSNYITIAKKKYRNYPNTRFIIGDLNTIPPIEKENYDIILLVSVLHHISDFEAKNLISSLPEFLKNTGGMIVSYDPVLIPYQNHFSKFLMKIDRGNYIRDEKKYITLFDNYFKIESVYSDVVSFSYPVLIIKATSFMEGKHAKE